MILTYNTLALTTPGVTKSPPSLFSNVVSESMTKFDPSGTYTEPLPAFPLKSDPLMVISVFSPTITAEPLVAALFSNVELDTVAPIPVE